MPDLDDPTDVDHTDADDTGVYDTDQDLLRRPLPPRTWRDRLDELAAGGGAAGRVVAAVAVLVVVGAVGWRLLAPPAPPPEMAIPLAEPAAGDEADPARDAAAAAPEDAAAAGPHAAGSPVVGGAGPGGPDAAGGAGEAGAAGDVVVHVVGAVVAPGVQRLPAGSRVIDAVERAGGAAGDADLARINLAAPLADGQQVYVLRIGEVAPMPPVGAAAGAAGSPAGGDAAGGPVDINRATATELEELPGVGPATAEAIIAHREQNGPFTSVDDLIDVRGIGDAKLEQIRPQATV